MEGILRRQIWRETYAENPKREVGVATPWIDRSARSTPDQHGPGFTGLNWVEKREHGKKKKKYGFRPINLFTRTCRCPAMRVNLTEAY